MSASPAMTEDYKIGRVAIGVEKNTLMFFDTVADDEPCGQWGLYGGWHFPYEVDQRDCNHWQPYAQIPPIIAYVNYAIGVHVYPENKVGIANFARILEEQIPCIADISQDMRHSIDEQITSVPPARWKELRRKAKAREFDMGLDELFESKEEYLSLHDGPNAERLVF